MLMDTVELPQANRLDVVRRLVDGVAQGVTDAEALGHQLRLSSRHFAYYRQAARILGWLAPAEPLQVTPLGRALLATPSGSPTEATAMEYAVRNARPLKKVAHDLFDFRAPSENDLANRIVVATALSPSTAIRRSQTLLSWRDRILTQKTSPFQVPLAMPERKVLSRSDPKGGAPSGEKLVPRHPEVRSLVSLRLLNFKNFRDATVPLGPLTLVTGTNASGKSNIRDAFRFLHGVARGYTLAEIIGEKWIEGGVLQWRGLRGGSREAAFRGERSFAMEVGFQVLERGKTRDASYRIEVDLGTSPSTPPRVKSERLVIEGRGQSVYDSHPPTNAPPQEDPLHLSVRLRKEGQKGFLGPAVKVINNRPALSQLVDHPDVKLAAVREHVRLALTAFQSMRFLDLSPAQMRLPSLPGQTILGDQGENLSSVLQALCDDPSKKKALVEWVRELTPLDAIDFDFPADQTGKVLVSLIEDSGHRTSAHSASDGTLRFLAMIAALLGPEPARFYFFEELENGIHPTRLHLLLRLIERQASTGILQVVATTHSPSLLTSLSEESQNAALVVCRMPGEAEATVKRIVDIPEARRNLRREDLGRLLASGWLEDAVIFSAKEKTK